jgi:PHD/YefM family antitoxin component YafN of YafNO toxin-antitoxin module
MTITTLTSREFNQDTSAAKKATRNGPVFITDRSRPAHVLLAIEEYQKLTAVMTNMVDLLAMPNSPDNQSEIEFEPVRLNKIYQPADLS